VTQAGGEGPDADLIERAEALLRSLTTVVSARVIVDEESGAHVHVLATTEMSMSEISRAVTSALTAGLGFEVPADQVTVVQSRLSIDKLKDLVGSEAVAPAPAPPLPAEPLSSPPDPAEPELSPPEPAEPEPSPPDPVPPLSSPPDPPLIGQHLDVGRVTPDPDPDFWAQDPDADSWAHDPDPEPPAQDPELVEYGLDGSARVTQGGPDPDVQRLELQDLQVNRNPGGGFEILVRLTGNGRSIGAQREATASEQDSLSVPASTTVGVIQEFLKSENEEGAQVALEFLNAERVQSPGHDVVVVLVEADLDGASIPLTGAASAHQGVERASILATLQATNELVAGTLMAEPTDGASTT
jgi:hypothetical protein